MESGLVDMSWEANPCAVVLTAMLIYLVMAINLPQWPLKRLTKSKEVICGEGARKHVEGIVSWHGR